MTIQYTATTVTVFAPTREALHCIQELEAMSNLENHTYTEDGAKDKKCVIEGLPPFELDEMKASLQEQGVTPKKLVQLKHSRQIEHPIYYLSVHPATNLVEITNIRYICNIRIRWEKYENPRRITQSMRHGSGNCNRKPKCVKCSEGNLSTECSKARDKPAKCANCAGPQTANAPTCE